MTVPFAFQKDDLPTELPLFPLANAVLLPGGHLPLNIFEPRYLAMVDYALKTDRMIGMIQPSSALADAHMPALRPLAATGCAGRITGFEETDDGRYMLVLTGICRFHIAAELPLLNGFRRATPDWNDYRHDILPQADLSPQLRTAIMKMLVRYFTQQNIEADWQAVKHASDSRLITCLAMICPFTSAEKQALLEAQDCPARAQLFLTMLEMAVHAVDDGPDTQQ
ncbi:MAG: LON peptidase substrate-binding domain-containing protein [Pseudomonadota bacterium]